MSRSTPRKSRKSSIYRHIENITLWVMDISGKTPKVEPFISQTKRVTDELENALATCQYADDEKVLEEKMKLINIMCYHLTSAKVVIRLWHQYSLRHTEIRKIIDEKQIFDIDYDLSNITIKKGFSNRKEIYDEYRTEIQ